MSNVPRTLPKVVYSSGLDDLSQRLLAGVTTMNYADVRPQFLPELEKLTEALVISPRVVLRVSYRNLILPMLLDFYQDVGLVLDLMRSGALEFIMFTHGIMSLGSVVLGGSSPIPAEHDAATLAELHLSAIKGLTPTQTSKLISQFVASTVETDAIAAAEAVAVAERFADLGMFGDRIPNSSAFVDSKSPAVTDAARHAAEDIFATSIVLRNEYDIFETDGTWDAIVRVGNDIRRSSDVVDAVEHVYKEASVPSVRTLIHSGRVTAAEIVKLRSSPATRAFRNWLWKADDPNDGLGLAAEYIQTLNRGLDSRDGALYRNSRIVTASVVGQGGSIVGSAAGAAAGHAVAGDPGAVVGAGIGGYLGSTAVSLADPWIPDYLRKPDPRQFTEHILRPLSRRSGSP
jgi:hypothetical protein